jgi:hypothetical protein
MDLPDLIEREGCDYPLDRVRMRLYCIECRRRTQALRIVYTGAEGKAALFRYAR